jgi:site-specific DNA-methyltransferase (adenine-specific)
LSRVTVTQGDCVEVLRAREGRSFDAVVTDPPYELGFMGRAWDRSGVAFRPDTWRAVLDQMRPGAHLVAFSGTRTYHRMACAVEDAGFEVRDQLAWVYGSGFPKSLDVSKAIDRAAGAEREVVGRAVYGDGHVQASGESIGYGGSDAAADLRLLTAPATPDAARWSGWGTALKPAWEPILLARRPLAAGTVAVNVLAHRTGAINVDACRVPHGEVLSAPRSDPANRSGIVGAAMQARGNAERNAVAQAASIDRTNTLGRFPANLLHDGSAEVEALFPRSSDGVAVGRNRSGGRKAGEIYGDYGNLASPDVGYGGSGSAARFYYSAKAGPLDRLGSEHPTVKPVDLMRWLVRLVTPPGGLVLDPFAGSGTTGIAALAEGADAELIDLVPAHVADVEAKLAHLRGDGARIVERHLRRRSERARAGGTAAAMPLFGDEA